MNRTEMIEKAREHIKSLRYQAEYRADPEADTIADFMSEFVKEVLLLQQENIELLTKLLDLILADVYTPKSASWTELTWRELLKRKMSEKNNETT